MKILFVPILGLALFSCSDKEADNINITHRTICNDSSEWRDNNGIDSCSFYSNVVSCKKILGKLKIKSRLHKNSLEKNIFSGGMSSRWLEIDKNTIKYFKPSGEIADQGKCNCKNGILKVKWENDKKRWIKYEIYFNSENFVELRYHDYPFKFNNLNYEKTKPPTNPTKIIGSMEY